MKLFDRAFRIGSYTKGDLASETPQTNGRPIQETRSARAEATTSARTETQTMNCSSEWVVAPGAMALSNPRSFVPDKESPRTLHGRPSTDSTGDMSSLWKIGPPTHISPNWTFSKYSGPPSSTQSAPELLPHPIYPAHHQTAIESGLFPTSSLEAPFPLPTDGPGDRGCGDLQDAAVDAMLSSLSIASTTAAKDAVIPFHSTESFPRYFSELPRPSRCLMIIVLGIKDELDPQTPGWNNSIQSVGNFGVMQSSVGDLRSSFQQQEYAVSIVGGDTSSPDKILDTLARFLSTAHAGDVRAIALLGRPSTAPESELPLKSTGTPFGEAWTQTIQQYAMTGTIVMSITAIDNAASLVVPGGQIVDDKSRQEIIEITHLKAPLIINLASCGHGEQSYGTLIRGQNLQHRDHFINALTASLMEPHVRTWPSFAQTFRDCFVSDRVTHSRAVCGGSLGWLTGHPQNPIFTVSDDYLPEWRHLFPVAKEHAPRMVGAANDFASSGTSLLDYSRVNLCETDTFRASGLYVCASEGSLPPCNAPFARRYSLTSGRWSTTARASVISRTSGAAMIVDRLVDSGCIDITSHLDLKLCDNFPVYRGECCDVYRGVLKGGRKVAIKCSRVFFNPEQDGVLLKNIARELYAWSKLNHPNILELTGLSNFRGALAIVTPWMENGTLSNYMLKEQVNAYQLCVQIAAGLAHVHRANIVHGDIKGSNVVISASGVAKLIDFGNTVIKNYAVQFTSTSTPNPKMTIRWAAPELIRGESKQTKQSDVYALGMLDEGVYWAVGLDGRTPGRPKELNQMESVRAKLLWKMMVRCWDHQASKRPTSAWLEERLTLIEENQALRIEGFSEADEIAFYPAEPVVGGSRLSRSRRALIKFSARGLNLRKKWA
ncbi:Tyrosine-protein kinase [Ceratobasidium sp. AG-Ba]|nr:Tyrosine-protein kinase [Ceratobasidium sp. AG-Ba]